MLDRFLTLASHGLLGADVVMMLVYLLVMTQLTIFTVTLYLHRSQTHRSVNFHPALAHAFRFWSWLTTSMVTREWVAVHCKHHAHVDAEQDPHSPYIAGIHTLLWKGTELYTMASQDKQLLATYGRGTPDDWIERHIYTPHGNWGPTLLAVISLALFGVRGMAIWAVEMMWIPFWAAGVVNGIGHWWGYRNFETPDKSANVLPWPFGWEARSCTTTITPFPARRSSPYGALNSTSVGWLSRCLSHLDWRASGGSPTSSSHECSIERRAPYLWRHG